MQVGISGLIKTIKYVSVGQIFTPSALLVASELKEEIPADKIRITNLTGHLFWLLHYAKVHAQKRTLPCRWT